MRRLNVDGPSGLLVLEVQQHLGGGLVRTVAMDATDGLPRGVDARATGSPIMVPVGPVTLGRIFNVIGEAIDGRPTPESDQPTTPSTAPHLTSKTRAPTSKRLRRA